MDYVEHNPTMSDDVEIAAARPETEKSKDERRRERAAYVKAHYCANAELVDNYLKAEGSSDRLKALLLIDERVLQTVFGEGLPLKYVFHSFSGLTGRVAEHSMVSRTGTTIVDRMRDVGATPEQIEAAQSLVSTYEYQSQLVRDRSDSLRRLLAPLERSGDEQISQEEIDFATSMLGENDFWVHDSQVELKRSRRAYHAMIEPTFGSVFRRYVLRMVTKEEFAELRAQMEAAFQGIVDSC